MPQVRVQAASQSERCERGLMLSRAHPCWDAPVSPKHASALSIPVHAQSVFQPEPVQTHNCCGRQRHATPNKNLCRAHALILAAHETPRPFGYTGRMTVPPIVIAGFFIILFGPLVVGLGWAASVAYRWPRVSTKEFYRLLAFLLVAFWWPASRYGSDWSFPESQPKQLSPENVISN